MKGLVVFFVIASLGVVLSTPARSADPPICPPYDPEGYVVMFPNPDDCTKFYMCDDEDVAVEFTCPGGLWYNPDFGVCDNPDSVPEGICKPPPVKRLAIKTM